MIQTLTEWLGGLGLSEWPAHVLARVLAVVLVFLLSGIAYLIAKRVIVRGVRYLIQRTSSTRDDALLRHRVFSKLSNLVPALVIYVLAPLALEGHENWQAFFKGLALLYMVVVVVLVLDSLLSAAEDIYETFTVSRDIHIKGIVQILKVTVYFLGVIFSIAVILNKTPLYLLSGLGALTAVMMLIFKDAILGFVAGIQLTANKMVARGDWLEMPKYGADGDVVEIALTTVKVQNWDKTITTVPTYALISDSFKNWRGMSESGGRRIKRAIHIDLGSIRFCDREMLERFARIQYIREYLDRKKEELSAHNEQNKVDDASLVNGRHLTNIGTFRAYVVAYLRNHPMVNQDMTFLVRHLAPGAEGLPIEIYVFCTDKAWANYEAIQADIFDHILAAVPEFDLKVYQRPTGSDLRALRNAE